MPCSRKQHTYRRGAGVSVPRSFPQWKIPRPDSNHSEPIPSGQAGDERYRTLFNYAPDGIIIADRAGRYLDANPSVCRMLGYSHGELVGKSASDIVMPSEIDHVEPALSTIHGPSAYRREWQFRRKDGSTFTADVMATVMPDGNLLAIFRDLTERDTLQAQLHQTQKMEAIGRLAGGVAHDFNNLLTVMLGFCEMLLDGQRQTGHDRTSIEQIQRAATRAAEVTRQLLAFSRQEIIELKNLDVATILTDMQPMLGRLIREDVHVVYAVQAGLAAITADRGQLEQVIVNLAVNAQDAMPGGGTLTIEAVNARLDAGHSAPHFNAAPGPYVAITVRDSGKGMTAAVQERLFEPFFTTKPPGEGTGLGLATVHGIVARAGGSVSVRSELGRGTSFTVNFPQAATVETPVELPAPAGTPQNGTEAVLVVEDAAILRDLTQRLLERRGYTVLVAASAAEAIRQFEEHPSIRLILTDVVMPGMSGPALTRLLLERRPDVKVIYMSGYTDEAIVQHGVLKPGIAFLQKPFTANAVARKVREKLDEPVGVPWEERGVPGGRSLPSGGKG